MSLRIAIASLLRPDELESCIDPDESVVFFPTAAAFHPPNQWQVPIHGWIYQPSELSRLRRLGFRLVARLIKLRYRHVDHASPLFRERVGAFLADNERGSRIEIQVGPARFQLKKSRADGHFEGMLNLPGELVNPLFEKAERKARRATRREETGGDSSLKWLTFRAVTRATDERRFDGKVLFLPPEGLSVISDIDDTIKVTEVLERKKLLRNTFLKEFRAVPEMAALYRRWARGRGAVFHYVSASPWHLYPFLSEFLAAQGFPMGTFHLRDFRLVPGSFRKALVPSGRVKLRHVRSLLTRFPRRRFILVGDSGESDPELYGNVAREFPGQVEKIYIRNITGEAEKGVRWRKVFRGLRAEQWEVFEDAAGIGRG
jgi:hypothetical protein